MKEIIFTAQQENHEYLIRIFARNEVGLSDPLESEEPFKVLRPTGESTFINTFSSSVRIFHEHKLKTVSK